MAKLFSLPLAFCLLATPAQGAPAQHPAADSLRVRASGAGKLFLGGNLIESPWTLSYEAGRLTVNGYGIAPPKPAPPRQLSPAELEEHAFYQRMDAAYKSAMTLPLEKRLERFTAFCDSNSKWIRIEQTAPTSAEARLWNGYQIGYSFQPYNSQEATPEQKEAMQKMRDTLRTRHVPTGESLEASRLYHLRFIAHILERGGVVFLDGGTEIYPNDPGCVLAAISQLRTGTPLDSAALHCLPQMARDQIKKPKELARYIER